MLEIKEIKKSLKSMLNKKALYAFIKYSRYGRKTS